MIVSGIALAQFEHFATNLRSYCHMVNYGYME